ncbi:chemotaxis protein CheA [Candidatus Kapabacteria bacterium]|nr:chemotaxis protein CheA [Candidatus Kapabacteria bacterium]
MSAINDDMREIFEGYLVETNELLESISSDLIELENGNDDPEMINQLFRSFHTIKGTSSFMGFDEITIITHEAEDLLNKLRKDELTISEELTDILLEVHDWIRELVDKRKDGDESNPNYSATITKIKALKGSGAESSVNSETSTSEESSGSGSSFDAVLDQSKEIGSGDGDFTEDEEALLQQAFAEINSNFDSEDVATEESTDSQMEVKEEPKPEIKENKPEPIKKEAPKKDNKPAKPPQESIRIDVDRIETLMDLSGELVLGRNRLSQISEFFDAQSDAKENTRDLIETAAQIDFVTSEIQSAVMKMRMVPVAKLYQKAPRIVRDLSKEFSKKIKLVVKGEETEIDRGIIEELNDPLVHMIRNSCDHGIESPAERLKAEKPEIGTVILDADQEGNHIVLRISDDGKGMDPNALVDKAIEKGIITTDQADQMTDREIFQLIFAPGFSTAKKLTDVSGRGVGMDVVKTNIQKLKGIIDIDSKLGKGTSFTVKLPLTLAIIQGLLVKVKNETYAIPLSSVEEVVSVEENIIDSVNRQEVIRIREDVYPITRLGKTLGLDTESSSLVNKNVVVVGLGINRVGLVVDELLGQQEIVIKSLGDYLGDIQGIAGSTILGDGRVIMIIDINELINQIYNK